MENDHNMKKVPFAFQNTVRKVYFDLLKRFIEDQGLCLDLEHYAEDAIISSHFLRDTVTIATIYSHSPWGEPNDLTNESTSRTYNGLKIIIWNSRYREKIDKIADNMKRHLEEDVIVEEMSDEEKFCRNLVR